jgi:hypothetical protein
VRKIYKFTLTIKKQKPKTKTIMKKSIALVAMAFGVTSAFAQDLTSKKGEPILPEAGDYAISVDATPFLNYVGNFFGKTNNNVAPSWNYFTTNQTIVGKYFKDAKTAYRVGIRLGFGGPTVTNTVGNRMDGTAQTYPDAPRTVENKWSQSNTNVGISVGYEKRKGKTRLQGFYGADLGLNFTSTKNSFTYGNALLANSTSTATPDVNVSGADAFAGANNTSNTTGITGINASGARATVIKSGVGVQLGIRAFIGAEYFILPKISLGGEFGWGLGLNIGGRTSTTWESVGTASAAGSNPSVATTKIDGGKTTSFMIDTDKNTNVGGSIFGASGSLRLAFHF